MYKDFKIETHTENSIKQQAYMWKECEFLFKRLEIILRAGMYDKRYLVSSELRNERLKIKEVMKGINTFLLNQSDSQKRGPLVKPLCYRINQIKEKIEQNPERFNMDHGATEKIQND